MLVFSEDLDRFTTLRPSPAGLLRFLDLHGGPDPVLLGRVERKSARIARHVPKYG